MAGLPEGGVPGSAPVPQVPVVTETILRQVSYLVLPTPGASDGAATRLVFYTPFGDHFVIPLDEKAAKAIGGALLAPRVAMPGDGGPPGRVNGHGG